MTALRGTAARLVAVACFLSWSVAIGCGGQDTPKPAEDDDPSEPGRVARDLPPAEEGRSETTPPTVDAIVRDTLRGGSRPPAPCDLLTPSDARDVLGEDVSGPRSFDIAGDNCVYDGADSGRRLSLVVYRGPTLDETQFGLEVGHCGGEVVERREDLGTGAALYRMAEEPCDGGYRLAVTTGVRFEGSEPPPNHRRPLSGHLHFVLNLAPPPDDRGVLLETLAVAAERALTRLRAELGDGG